MILYPAIDIRDGRAVRLIQGDYDRETAFDADPLDAARRWVDQGAEALHVVDLDGAREGAPVNLEQVLRICAVVSVPVQLGGGLREAGDVSAAFEAGAERVVLGTAAFRPGAARGAVEEHGERIAVAADVRGDRVAIEGWNASPRSGRRRSSAIWSSAGCGVSSTPSTSTARSRGRTPRACGGRRSGGGSRCRADLFRGIGDLEHLRALADAQLPALSGVIRRTGSTSAGVHRRRGPRGPRRRAVAVVRAPDEPGDARAADGRHRRRAGARPGHVAMARGPCTGSRHRPRPSPRPRSRTSASTRRPGAPRGRARRSTTRSRPRREVGANTNRLTVRWFDVVGPSGAWDEDGWARYGTAYQTMLLAGIQPIVMLVAAPGAPTSSAIRIGRRRDVSRAAPRRRRPSTTSGGRSSSRGRASSSPARSRSRSGTSRTPRSTGAVATSIPPATCSSSTSPAGARAVREDADRLRRSQPAVDEPAGMPWTDYLQRAL